MDEEFKRFEDKQKYANLEIEKRFVSLQQSVDELKTQAEKASLMENSSKELGEIKGAVSQMKSEMESIRAQIKKDMEHTTNLVAMFDTSEMKKQIETLTGKVDAVETRFDKQIKGVEMLEEKILEARNDEKVRNLFVKVKEIEMKLESLHIKISSIIQNELTKPIFIE